MRAVPADNSSPTLAMIDTPLGVTRFVAAHKPDQFSRSGRGDFLLPIMNKHAKMKANQALNDTFPEGERYEECTALTPPPKHPQLWQSWRGELAL